MVNFKVRYLFLLLIPAILFVYASPVNKQCTLTVISGAGEKIRINVELADTPPEREKGLMFRKSMKENNGMLFVFPEEKPLSFWMKNTYIPLDIAYIDKNAVINEIYTMKALDVSVIYNSIKPAMYALEMNSGWFNRHNIKPGSKIELNGCIGKQNSIIKR
jgi:uncharacterized membrane protein (UPF0127 family)